MAFDTHWEFGKGLDGQERLQPEYIQDAIAAFQQRYGRQPSAVMVNSQQVTTVRKVLAGSGVSVEDGKGGPHINEIWLRRNE